MHQEFDSRSIAIYWGQGGKLSYGDPLLTEMKRSGTPHARPRKITDARQPQPDQPDQLFWLREAG